MIFQAYLQTLRRTYAAHGLSLDLVAGNAEAALAESEARLGFPIAPGLWEAWRAADGGADGAHVFLRPGFLTGYDFLSLAAAEKARANLRRRSSGYAGYVEPEPRDARIRGGWYHDGWLPFAAFGGGTLLLMQDHAPGAIGAAGQIIAFTHDPDEIGYVSPDFARFLDASLNAIEADPEAFLELS